MDALSVEMCVCESVIYLILFVFEPALRQSEQDGERAGGIFFSVTLV